jgi:predicted transcriptional regulator
MALTLKKKKILQLWIGNPRKWIRSADLRKTLVLGFNKDYIYNEQLHKWKNIVTGAEYDKKPLPYTDASKFYGDLKSLIKDGILENKKIKQDKGKPKSMYRPTKKHMLHPLKNHYVSFIENKDIKQIHHGLDYMLLLPENLTVNEFLGKKQDLIYDKKHINVERAALFEEAFDRFCHSARRILFEARLEKAKELWEVKIENNMAIYPPLKLHLGIELLKNQLIKDSPALCVKYIDGKEVVISKKLQNSLNSLSNMLFWDILMFWYRPKDIEKMNDKMQSSFKDNAEYINNIWAEICNILEEKEFGVVISPAALLKPSPDFSKGVHWLLEKQEEQKLLKLIKGKKNGKTKVYQKMTVIDPTKKIPFLLYLDEIEKTIVEFGEWWFNVFSENTQKKLRKLCDDLSYSELGMYQMLGLFTFPFPTLIMPDTTFDIDKNETGIDRNVTELDKKYLEPL